MQAIPISASFPPSLTFSEKGSKFVFLNVKSAVLCSLAMQGIPNFCSRSFGPLGQTTLKYANLNAIY